MQDLAAESTPRGWLPYLATAAVVSTYLLIVLGGTVRATGSGLGCPDWPLCDGSLLPPFRASALIEFSHRLAAAITSPLILLTAIMAWRARSPAARPAWVGVGLLVVQVILGAISVRLRLPAEIVAAHLGVALAILGFSIWTAVAVWVPRLPTRLRQKFLRRDLGEAGTIFLLFLVLVSGTWVAASQAGFACSGWPLCGGAIWPVHELGKVHMAHRIAVAGAGLALLAIVQRAWRERYQQPGRAVASATALCLFAGQAAVGAVGVGRGFPPELIALHVATGSAVWGALVLHLALGVAAPADPLSAPNPVLRPRASDYVALTKPLIVGLLLVTTLAGMVVGAGAWPDTTKVIVTLLGGALCAGGAGAINQYIDRDRDLQMTRTRRRPIPRGALGPADALSFGIGLCIAGFFLFALVINLLSALLALAGMLYYILLYSLALKATTPQNIVIGGGAGAIPPLVGWAAATGRLEAGAFFLFALIFFWTPPHFWALALVRKQDYAQAGIPMYPVVYGDRVTRRHIFLYAVQVVALSLLLPLARLGGGISFAAAAILGIWFLWFAWRLWREGGPKLAWGLYRYSSLYLALLFAALVADTLVRG